MRWGFGMDEEKMIVSLRNACVHVYVKANVCR